ncbi:MAG: ribose 5-phosphate isomerase B [Candidatus Omnitrophica bacterium]|nr:ribose 5-phosphate isomerase B [Candidatus Omnitrophota bacterium]MCK5393011.1 ribose 5-phosphate isomerase B [Candidatus Omnitrophota bacterium]
MKIAIACDHRGVKLKNTLIQYLEDKGYTVVDYGTHSTEPCDYPDYTYMAAKSVRDKVTDRAIIICYTGEGSCIVANKVKGIRAALGYNLKSAYMSRRHNNSNALVLPSCLFKADYIKKMVFRWLKEDFEGGRHLRRVRKIKEIEEMENV